MSSELKHYKIKARWPDSESWETWGPPMTREKAFVALEQYMNRCPGYVFGLFRLGKLIGWLYRTET